MNIWYRSVPLYDMANFLGNTHAITNKYNAMDDQAHMQ